MGADRDQRPGAGALLPLDRNQLRADADRTSGRGDPLRHRSEGPALRPAGGRPAAGGPFPARRRGRAGARLCRSPRSPAADTGSEQARERGVMGHPNESLIGVPGGRAQLDTPALIVELAVLDRNIRRMAAFAAAKGVGLRPHAKTHKSDEIARRQLAAGAIGICCATLSEADIMVRGGIPGVLITSPVVTPAKIARLIRLAAQAGPDGLMVVADHPDAVRALDAA